MKISKTTAKEHFITFYILTQVVCWQLSHILRDVLF